MYRTLKNQFGTKTLPPVHAFIFNPREMHACRGANSKTFLQFKSFHLRTSGVIHKGDTSSPRVSRLRHRLWKVFASRPPGAQNRRGDRPLSLFAACLPCVYFASEQNKHQSCNGIAITYLSSRAIESGKKIRCKVASWCTLFTQPQISLGVYQWGIILFVQLYKMFVMCFWTRGKKKTFIM